MKVLVATAKGQGQDPDDHCWATDGELVRLFDCTEPGCDYTAFVGIESHEATSTALVVERRDLDPYVLSLAFRQDWENRGLTAGRDEDVMRLEIEAEIAGIADWLQHVESGAVVERTGRVGAGLQVRQVMA